MAKPEPEENEGVIRCPNCSSTNIAGLMESFWVPLNGDGEPDGDWNDWSSETELSEKRMCYDCGEEF